MSATFWTLDKCFVVGSSIVPDFLDGIDGWRNVAECMSQVSESSVVTRALHRAALCVTQHNDQLRTRKLGGELDTANDVSVSKVAGNPGTEDITNPLIKNKFGGHTRVDAAKHHSERELPRSCRPNLSHQVTLEHPSVYESLVTVLERPERLLWRHCALRFS